MESDFVTSDPNEMIELLLGIPDVRVLGLVEDDAGLWVEIENNGRLSGTLGGNGQMHAKRGFAGPALLA